MAENNDPQGQQGQQDPTEPGEGQQQQGAQQQGSQPQQDPSDGQQGGGSGAQWQTVNRYKHEREMAAKDARIKELEAQLGQGKKDEDAVAALRKEFDDYKAAQEAASTSKALEAQGCINVKAASALLDDYDGDISKMKEAVPYLFKSDNPTKSTGGNPKGDPQAAGERERRMRSYLGLD